MLNPELDDFISSELSRLSDEMAADLPAAERPKHLFYRTDAPGLDAMLRHGVVRAWHSRLATHVGIAGYGIAFVERWLQIRHDQCQPGLSQDFCRAVIDGLHPRGAHFDFFVVRLFASPVALQSLSDADRFAVAIRCQALPWRASSTKSNANAGHDRG